jgi:nucleoside-diphosphate-sugar epimerase
MGDLSVQGEAEKLIADRPDVIFHLAAIVSGEAEADFEKGYRINLDGTRYLFEAIRKAGGGYKPKPDLHLVDRGVRRALPGGDPDDYFTTPLTSYGTQKAICELLLSDYSRRGFIDGVGSALPDGLRPARQAQSGGVGLLLQHHPRAAGRHGSRAAGGRGCAPLACSARARPSAS